VGPFLRVCLSHILSQIIDQPPNHDPTSPPTHPLPPGNESVLCACCIESVLIATNIDIIVYNYQVFLFSFGVVCLIKYFAIVHFTYLTALTCACMYRPVGVRTGAEIDWEWRQANVP